MYFLKVYCKPSGTHVSYHERVVSATDFLVCRPYHYDAFCVLTTAMAMELCLLSIEWSQMLYNLEFTVTLL